MDGGRGRKRKGKRRSSGFCNAICSAEEWERKQLEQHSELAKKGKGMCFACGKSFNFDKLLAHPCLGLPECQSCNEMYHSGTFTLQDGKEMYCRMCGNGGELFCCDEEDDSERGTCVFSFCIDCIRRSFGQAEVERLSVPSELFACWICKPSKLEAMRNRLPGYEGGKRKGLPVVLKALYAELSRISAARVRPKIECGESSPDRDSSLVPSNGKKRPRLAAEATMASVLSPLSTKHVPNDKADGSAQLTDSNRSDDKGGGTGASCANPSSSYASPNSLLKMPSGSRLKTGDVPTPAGEGAEDDREPLDLSVEEARAWVMGDLPISGGDQELYPYFAGSCLLAPIAIKPQSGLSSTAGAPTTGDGSGPGQGNPMTEAKHSLSAATKGASTSAVARSPCLNVPMWPGPKYGAQPSLTLSVVREAASLHAPIAEKIADKGHASHAPPNVVFGLMSGTLPPAGVGGEKSGLRMSELSHDERVSGNSSQVASKRAMEDSGSCVSEEEMRRMTHERRSLSRFEQISEISSSKVPKPIPQAQGATTADDDGHTKNGSKMNADLEAPAEAGGSSNSSAKGVCPVYTSAVDQGPLVTSSSTEQGESSNETSGSSARDGGSSSSSGADVLLRRPTRLSDGPDRVSRSKQGTAPPSSFWNSFLNRSNRDSIGHHRSNIRVDRNSTGNIGIGRGVRNISTLLAEQQQRSREHEAILVKDCDLSTDSSDNDDDEGVGMPSSHRAILPTAFKVFDWDHRFMEKGGLLVDASRGMEKVPIQVINEYDHEKLPYFQYVTNYVMGKGVGRKDIINSMVCCNCTEGCRDPVHCACLRLRASEDGSCRQIASEHFNRQDSKGVNKTARVSKGAAEGASRSGAVQEMESVGLDDISRFYSDDKLLLREPRAIYECHAGCACNPTKCRNRVVSKGVQLRLQVFRCPEPNKGWGLRCMERIPAGTFVACYLGEVLRESDGDTRGMEHGDSYLFSLDKFSGECDDDDREWEPHRDLLENREEVKPYKQGGFGSAEGKEGSPSRISSFSPRKKLGMTAKCSRSRHPGVGGPVGGFPRVDGGTVISPPASKRGRLAFKVEESAIGNASASTEAVGASSLSAGPGADANHAAKSEMEVGVNGSAESKEDTEPGTGGSESTPMAASTAAEETSNAGVVIDLCDSDESDKPQLPPSSPAPKSPQAPASPVVRNSSSRRKRKPAVKTSRPKKGEEDIAGPKSPSTAPKPGTDEKNELFGAFTAATGCTDVARCMFFLEGAGGNLSTAVNHFLDFKESMSSEELSAESAPTEAVGAAIASSTPSTRLETTVDSGTETDEDRPYWNGKEKVAVKRSLSNSSMKQELTDDEVDGDTLVNDAMASEELQAEVETKQPAAGSSHKDGESKEANGGEVTDGPLSDEGQANSSGEVNSSATELQVVDISNKGAENQELPKCTQSVPAQSAQGSSEDTASRTKSGGGSDAIRSDVYENLPHNPSHDELEEWNRKEREEWRRQQEQKQLHLKQQRKTSSPVESKASLPHDTSTIDEVDNKEVGTTVSAPEAIGDGSSRTPDVPVSDDVNTVSPACSEPASSKVPREDQEPAVVVLTGSPTAQTFAVPDSDSDKAQPKSPEVEAPVAEPAGPTIVEGQDDSKGVAGATGDTTSIASRTASSDTITSVAAQQVPVVTSPSCATTRTDVESEEPPSKVDAGPERSISPLRSPESAAQGDEGDRKAETVGSKSEDSSSPAKLHVSGAASVPVVPPSTTETTVLAGSSHEAQVDGDISQVCSTEQHSHSGDTTSAEDDQDFVGDEILRPKDLDASVQSPECQQDEQSTPSESAVTCADLPCTKSRESGAPPEAPTEVTAGPSDTEQSVGGVEVMPRVEGAPSASSSSETEPSAAEPDLATSCCAAEGNETVRKTNDGTAPLHAQDRSSGSACFRNVATGSQYEGVNGSREISAGECPVRPENKPPPILPAPLIPPSLAAILSPVDTPSTTEIKSTPAPECAEVCEISNTAVNPAATVTPSPLPLAATAMQISPPHDEPSANDQCESSRTIEEDANGVSHSAALSSAMHVDSPLPSVARSKSAAVSPTLGAAPVSCQPQITVDSQTIGSGAMEVDSDGVSQPIPPTSVSPDEGKEHQCRPSTSSQKEFSASFSEALDHMIDTIGHGPPSTISSNRNAIQGSSKGGLDAVAEDVCNDSRESDALQEKSRECNDQGGGGVEPTRLPEVEVGDAHGLQSTIDSTPSNASRNHDGTGTSVTPNAARTEPESKAMGMIGRVTEASVKPDTSDQHKINEGQIASAPADVKTPLTGVKRCHGAISSTSGGLANVPKITPVKKEELSNEPSPGVTAKQSPSPASRLPSEALCVDANAYGNVARFMNHSCDANLTKQMVFVDSHDGRMPLVAFFALHDIAPYQELTYNYGYVVGDVEGKTMECRCGSRYCRGFLL